MYLNLAFVNCLTFWCICFILFFSRNGILQTGWGKPPLQQPCSLLFPKVTFYWDSHHVYESFYIFYTVNEDLDKVFWIILLVDKLHINGITLHMLFHNLFSFKIMVLRFTNIVACFAPLLDGILLYTNTTNHSFIFRFYIYTHIYITHIFFFYIANSIPMCILLTVNLRVSLKHLHRHAIARPNVMLNLNAKLHSKVDTLITLPLFRIWGHSLIFLFANT